MNIFILLLFFIFAIIGIIATLYTIIELKEEVHNQKETKHKEELKSLVLEILDEILEDK